MEVYWVPDARRRGVLGELARVPRSQNLAKGDELKVSAVNC